MNKTNESSTRGVSINNRSSARCVAMANVKTSTTSTNDSTKPSIGNRRATNINVLGSSNKQTMDSNSKKMGTSTSQTSMSRRSITSKRNTSMFHANHPTKSTKRKSMDLKSSNRRPVLAIAETKKTDGDSTTVFVKPEKTSEKFNCTSCDMTFSFKTSLVAHQKSHATINTCKHCQRSFAISTALFKHVREHCTKISIADRKKLFDNDDKTSDLLNRTSVKTPTRQAKPRRSDKLLDLIYESCTPAQLDRLKAVPMKHFPPIKGIRHTPRKLINCYKCSKKFSDPCSYATHAEQCVAGKGGN